ncbi:unnamed protein product [Didymodactylos carnosus]|uniref:Homeobox domain-containing protein n=1 Tax=Didymodactylos carnosus TaxID=1234261 RepID=A0A814A525_9BILA|nr:unnamed protein product [Didymodactylos carnosus]CAF0908634.1 unnamed protein product [Didymodactylos carnosus]CAF3641525.1 unnamed protein product [Didymodactylos carnosus]CAF3690108.1 unnamed protein product [Didymodactylos carnosus]
MYTIGSDQDFAVQMAASLQQLPYRSAFYMTSPFLISNLKTSTTSSSHLTQNHHFGKRVRKNDKYSSKKHVNKYHKDSSTKQLSNSTNRPAKKSFDIESLLEQHSVTVYNDRRFNTSISGNDTLDNSVDDDSESVATSPFRSPISSYAIYNQLKSLQEQDIASSENLCNRKTSPLTTPRQNGTRPKRIRTIFTPEQLERLEAEFEKQQYMVGNERYYLATTLNLSEAQVKVWFQNRRIKWRRQSLEEHQHRLTSLSIGSTSKQHDDSKYDENHTEENDIDIDESTNNENQLGNI